MTPMAWWFLQNSITTAVLAVAVLLAGRFLKYRPALHHALWLVILLKFVTPPVLHWPWSPHELVNSLTGDRRFFSTLAPLEPRESTVQRPLTSVAREKIESALESGRDSGSHNPNTLPTTIRLDHRRIEDSRPSVIGAAQRRLSVGLMVGWLLGCVGLAVVQFRRLYRLYRVMRSGAPAPPTFEGEVRLVASRLRLRPPPAMVVRGIVSPFVSCLGRLRLVWPESLLQYNQPRAIRGIIAHELAHVRRRDHWVAWVELIAGMLWWWNPLFWVVRSRLRETADLTCDAIALSVCDDQHGYATIFLQLCSSSKTEASMSVLGVSTGTHSSFKRRLTMILSNRVSSKLSAGGILLSVLVTAGTLPSWSLAEAPATGKTAARQAEGPLPAAFRTAGPAQATPAEATLEIKPNPTVNGQSTSNEYPGSYGPVDSKPDALEETSSAADSGRPQSSFQPSDGHLNDDATRLLALIQAARQAEGPLPAAFRTAGPAQATPAEATLEIKPNPSATLEIKPNPTVNGQSTSNEYPGSYGPVDSKPDALEETSSAADSGRPQSLFQPSGGHLNDDATRLLALIQSGYLDDPVVEATVADAARAIEARISSLKRGLPPLGPDYTIGPAPGDSESQLPALQPKSRTEFEAQVELLKLDGEVAELEYKAAREQLEAMHAECDRQMKRRNPDDEARISALSALRQKGLEVDLADIKRKRSRGVLDLFMSKHPEFNRDAGDTTSTKRLSRGKTPSRSRSQIQAINDLKQINLALRTFVTKHRSFPETLDDCDSGDDSTKFVLERLATSSETKGLIYIRAPGQVTHHHHTRPVLIAPCHDHKCYVGLADGSVHILPRDAHDVLLEEVRDIVKDQPGTMAMLSTGSEFDSAEAQKVLRALSQAGLTSVSVEQQTAGDFGVSLGRRSPHSNRLRIVLVTQKPEIKRDDIP